MSLQPRSYFLLNPVTLTLIHSSFLYYKQKSSHYYFFCQVMTAWWQGEAVLCLWWAFGLLNHLKRRKHSRLKASQLDLITWYFQDVRPTTFLSSFSMYPIPYPVHFRSFDKNQTSAGSGPRPPTDHRCQNCQPVVLTGGGGKGEGEWLVSCFFFIIIIPNILQRHQGRRRVIV